jgi:GNAT superfamily N-acetyltransferase
MSELRIRHAFADEADRLTGIAHAAKRHWGYTDELIELWRDDLTITGDFISAHAIFCGVKGADITGFYALSHAGDTFELEHMWVHPDHIGTGVGARLFAHAVSTVRSLDGSVLRIASDPNAEGFYRRMGAQRVGALPSRPAGRTLPLLVFTVAPDAAESAT